MASHAERAAEVVAITGASAGVGRATALRFARDHARVALIARDPTPLEEVKAEIEALGGDAMCLPLDVADADAVIDAAERIERAFGPIDLWINDAMLTVFSPIDDITPDEFRRVTEATYLGVVYGTMAALRHMKPRNRGVIVQIGSALAYRGIPLQAAYCGAKYAIRGFTDSVRSELIHDRSGIRMTIVQLPAVNTPQFSWARTHMPLRPRPVPPVVQPEAVAEAVHGAAGGRRREYWLGASVVEVILGNMVWPEFLDRFVAKHAYESQERSLPVSPGRRDNLDAPVTDLHATRGAFDDEAADRVSSWSGLQARLTISLVAAAILVGIGVLIGWLI